MGGLTGKVLETSCWPTVDWSYPWCCPKGKYRGNGAVSVGLVGALDAEVDGEIEELGRDEKKSKSFGEFTG